MLYQFCAGEVPYNGDSPVAIALAHVGDAVPAIASLHAFMSPGLARIVLCVLAFAILAAVVAALRPPAVAVADVRGTSVAHARSVLSVDQNVCGLEIAMDDLLCVSGG